MFSGAVTSFVNQLADGTYVADLAVVTGAARPDLLGDLNCADWSGFNNGALSFTGYPEDTSTPFWNGGPGSGTGNTSLCNDTTTRVLCLQE